jgi:leucyl-tRNA synthetase
MVVAPEHPLVEEVLRATPEGGPAIRAYVERARNMSDVDRMEGKKKTGVFTGAYALNPATGEPIPVWIADYVLMGYGTGAIMAVPAHDERDYAFAKAYGLPIRDVVYDRTRAAMAFFARHAPSKVRTPERWQGALADFLGWVTSAGAFPKDMLQALEVVTTRRVNDSDGTAVMIPGGRPEDRPGGIGERRGATSIVWLDAIAEMKFDGVEDFTDRFTRGRFFEESGEAFVATGSAGVAANSANDEVDLNGMTVDDAKSAVITWLERKGIGRRRVNYKLRDWTFSRQRYWGEPFPMVFDEAGRAYPVSERALPVTLPELADYAPVESDDPLPLLGKVREWVHTTAGAAGVDPSVLPPETPVRREANTMPGSAGSSWYMLRYCDPSNDAALVSGEAERYWMGGHGTASEKRSTGGVDLYMGGSEHTVGHLLYSRFWHNVLHDLGYVSTPEPFQKLFHQGLITSFAYQRPDKTLVPCDQVEEVAEGQFVEKGVGTKLTTIVAKMSKSLKNVVNPDDVIAEFGADTFRLYEMYMGPLEASKPWNPRDITGLFRFLARAWRVAVDEKSGAVRLGSASDQAIEKQLHRMIAKVGADIERLSFNTAIAAMIEFVNAVGANPLTKDQLERFVLVLSPFAPHLTEEIWGRLGREGFASHAAWPTFDPAMLRDDQVELAVQIQGKVRCKVVVPSDAEPKAIEEMTLANSEVQKALAGKAVKKIIVVPGRLVNIVAG